MSASLNAVFVNHSSEVLADTEHGLSASQLIKACNAYSIEYDVEIPHTTIEYEARNKRTALAENLIKFSEPQRYRIIKDLCEHPKNADRSEVKKLKHQLIARYGHLAGVAMGTEVNEALIEQTRHWLDAFPEAVGLYNEALEKHANQIFQRNVLDDLRLSLELVVQQILGNEKSLENQLSPLGEFVKARGGSPEFVNMFVKLIDYYGKYQNNYVKHDDAVIEEEIEFIFELTSSFMKHLIRLSQRDL